MSVIIIDEETPRSSDMEALISELNATLSALTPAEYCYQLSIDDMDKPNITTFVIRDEGQAIGCGALCDHGNGVGEVKRMYIRPSHRGRKIGNPLLMKIITKAKALNLQRLVLETGSNYDAAISLYTKAGFARCGAVLDYPDSPYTAFFEKHLID